MRRQTAFVLSVMCFMAVVTGVPTIVAADEHNFCDKWSIYGLASPYRTSWSLTITENEIAWPGCQAVPYTVLSAEEKSSKLLIPKFDGNAVRKCGGNGCIVVLAIEHGFLTARVYDANSSMGKDQELAWGEFRRIPFDKERNFFGHIGNYPITMHLEVTRKGDVKGNYSYDKYKTEIPISGRIDGSNITLIVRRQNDAMSETFAGRYLDGGIEGAWKHKKKTSKFRLVREPWEDHRITCEQMQKYPQKVFLGIREVDLGSGAGSPNDVDYECEGGLVTLNFLKKLRDLSDQVRSEAYQWPCSGTLAFAQSRYYAFELLEAGLAPAIYAGHRKESEKNRRPARDYFKLWAHQSLYNFELYNAFWKEYNQIRRLLIRHYKDRFRLPPEKATYYADNALSRIVEWAAGTYPSSLQEGKPRITPIEEALAEPGITRETVENLVGHNIPQDTLDQALRAALLYQKPQNILEALLQKGARINSGDESALFFALRNRGNVEFLLKQGADVNYENGFGKTALFYAIGFNDTATVKLLLDHKADANHPYKTKKAIDEGPDRSPFYQSYCALSHCGRTPLMHAAQHSNVALIKLLIKHGARLDAIDEKEFNAADYARMGKKQENLDYLQSIGLKENAPESEKTNGRDN